MNRIIILLFLLPSNYLIAQSTLHELHYKIDQIQKEKMANSFSQNEEKLLFQLIQEYMKIAGLPIQENEGEIITQLACS